MLSSVEKINTPKELIFLSLELGYMDEIGWYFSSLGKLLKSNKWYRLDEGKVYLIADDREIQLAYMNKEVEYPLRISDRFRITRDEVNYLNEQEVEVTFGNFILNYFYIYKGLECKIPYIPKGITVGTIEKIVGSRLNSNPADGQAKDPTKIYVDDFLNFSRFVLVIKQLEQLISVSSSIGLLIPPEGLKEFIDKRWNYYVDKYGESFFETSEYYLAFMEEIRDFDRNSYGDDKALQMRNFQQVAREKNLFFAGLYSNIDLAPPVFVKKPLSEGHSLEPAHLAALANEIRNGSIGKGNQVKDSGVLSKLLLMLALGLDIKERDCGTRLGETFKVDESTYNMLIGGYYIDPKLPKVTFRCPDVSEARRLIGKIVTLRSLHYCKTNNGFCEMCCGDEMSKSPKGFIHSFINSGGKLLNINMKKMHGTITKLVTINLEDELKINNDVK